MNPKVLFILGPTAVGKTALSLEIAQKTRSPIINADSVQVYQGLDIGAAKPSSEELSLVPHHLMGHVPLGEDYTLGRFRREVLEIIDSGSQKTFLIVGGSGFYIRGLLSGLFEIPPVSEEVRESVRNIPKEALWKELSLVDVESAEELNPNDTYRLQRALEIYKAFKKPLSSFKKEFVQTPPSFSYKKIGLSIERSILKERLSQRAENMIRQGLIQEVAHLLEQGYGEWKALKSVGYKEVVDFLEGRLQEKDLVGEIVKNSMGLAKRQMTWFRKDKEIHWYHFEKEKSEAVKFGLDYLSELKNS